MMGEILSLFFCAIIIAISLNSEDDEM